MKAPHIYFRVAVSIAVMVTWFIGLITFLWMLHCSIQGGNSGPVTALLVILLFGWSCIGLLLTTLIEKQLEP